MNKFKIGDWIRVLDNPNKVQITEIRIGQSGEYEYGFIEDNKTWFVEDWEIS